MELNGAKELPYGIQDFVTIAETGEIVGNIEESFPSRMLTKLQMFVSLLFYYGMSPSRAPRETA